MNVEIYIAVLLTIIVIAIVVVAVAMVVAMKQLKRAARAVEYMAGRAEDQMAQIGDTMNTFGHVALGLVGGLGRKAALGAGLVYSLFGLFRRKRGGERTGSKNQGQGDSDE